MHHTQRFRAWKKVILLFGIGWGGVCSLMGADSNTDTYSDYSTTEGTEFWVTYMRNGGAEDKDYANLKLFLYATARENTTVTITNPRTGYSKSFDVPANTQSSTSVDVIQAYMEKSNEVRDRGLFVTSDHPISLYATNHKTQYYDGTNILPATSLEKEYVIQTYITDQDATEFAFVATMNYQTVHLSIRETVINSDALIQHNQIVVDSVITKDIYLQMHRGQTYLYRSHSSYTSLSGTGVCSNAPLAVFAGGQGATVPTAVGKDSHLFTQLYPTDQWGKQFIVTPTANHKFDIIRITAAENETEVYKNQHHVATLQAYETLQDTLFTPRSETGEYLYNTHYYETSQPTECFLYETSNEFNSDTTQMYGEITVVPGRYGAPTMTPVIPMEQGVNTMRFATFKEANTYANNHYVNIVVPTAAKHATVLDGMDIGDRFKPVAGNPDFSYCLFAFTSTASHLIENPLSPFTARVYGMGQTPTGGRESYAYSAGSRVQPAIEMRIDGVYQRKVSHCLLQPLTFTPEIEFEYFDYTWHFECRNSSQYPASFDSTLTDIRDCSVTFPYAGDWDVTLMVQRKTPVCDNYLIDTIMGLIHVVETIEINKGYSNTYQINICYGESFTMRRHGVDYPYVADTTTEQLIGGQLTRFRVNELYTFDDSLHSESTGCDSIVHQWVRIGPQYHKPIHDSLCVSRLPYSWMCKGTTTSTVVTVDLTAEQKQSLHATTTDPVAPILFTKDVTLPSALGCDSTLSLHIAILPEYHLLDKDTSCYDSTHTYVWPGHTDADGRALPGHHLRNAAGQPVSSISLSHPGANQIFRDSLTTQGCTSCLSAAGCDSVWELHLTVLPLLYIPETRAVCADDTVFWQNECWIGPEAPAPGSATYHRVTRLDTVITRHYTSSGPLPCDSTRELHLIFHPIPRTLIDTGVCYNDLDNGSFRWQLTDHTGDYSRSIPIDKDALPYNQTFQDTLFTTFDCDSIITLHLQVSPFLDSLLTDTICSDDQCTYRWPDHGIDPAVFCSLQPGAAYDFTDPDSINQYGCDSIYRLRLFIAPSYHQVIDSFICDGSTIAWQDTLISTSGTYYRHFLTQAIPSHPCDSDFTLNVLVGQPFYQEQDSFTCQQGDLLPGSYILYDSLLTTVHWKGKTYHCDSVYRLNLTVYPTYHFYDTLSICESDSISWHGIWFSGKRFHAYHPGGFDPSGTFRRAQTLIPAPGLNDTTSHQTTMGCDSIYHLCLHVHPIYDIVLSERVCQGAYYEYPNRFNGLGAVLPTDHVLDTTYVDTIPTHMGCDSIISLHFIVDSAYHLIQYDTVCQDTVHTYPWFDSNGNYRRNVAVRDAGDLVYTDTYPTQHGCDSIFELRLHVYPIYRFDSTYSICQHERIRWQNKWYAGDNFGFGHTILPSDLPDQHRDSVFHHYIPGDSILPVGISYDTVRFTTIHGCDSTYYLQLIVHPGGEFIEDHTACENSGEYVWNTTDADGLHTEIITWNPITRYITSTQKDTLFFTRCRTLRTSAGCDSTIHFHLTVYPTYEYVEKHQICGDDTLRWRPTPSHPDGLYYNTGVFYDSLPTQRGCDSVFVLELYVKPLVRIIRHRDICDHETLMHDDTLWYGPDQTRFTVRQTMLWQPGMRIPGPNDYRDVTYTSTTDWCDTLVYRYYIHVHQNHYYFEDRTLSSADLIPLHEHRMVGLDTVYSTHAHLPSVDTTFVDSLVSPFGCDSVFTLHALIHPSYRYVDADTICNTDTICWAHNNRCVHHLAPGDHVFYDSLKTALYRMDSVYEWHIHVHPSFYFQLQEYACAQQGYDFHGRQLYHSGVYYDSLLTIHGCDSIYRLQLTIRDTLPLITHRTICRGDTCMFHGRVHQDPGHYRYLTVNEYGCDQFIDLYLSVIEPTSYQLTFLPACDYLYMDTPQLEIHYEYQGRPLYEYSVLFDEFGHSQGFEDISHAPIQDVVNRFFTIPIPMGDTLPMPAKGYFDSHVGIHQTRTQPRHRYPEPNRYPITIILHNGICSEKLQRLDTVFELPYPSWIHEQRWNDGIVLYNEHFNGGYRFSHYQWYYNNQPLPNQTREFLYLPYNLAMNPDTLTPSSLCPNEYKVLLTRDSDGYSTFSCPICPVPVQDTIVPRKDYCSIVPTVVSKRNPVVWILSSQPGTYTVSIFDPIGNKLTPITVPTSSFTTHVGGVKNYCGEIHLPDTPTGYLLVRLTTDKGETRDVKILVQD